MKKWALIIGINGYHHSLGPLACSVNDAKLLQDTLTAEPCKFTPENCLLLADDQPKDCQPTFGNITSSLDSFLNRPTADDLLLVFFAGHAREHCGEVLLSPVDATLSTLVTTGISMRSVRSKIARSAAGQKVFILDACHTGAGRDIVAMSPGFRAALEVPDGVCVLASCDHDQISHEWKEKGCGVFTHFFIEGVRRSAPHDMDGHVTVDSAFEWARRRVIEWAHKHKTIQEPLKLSSSATDIVLAKREWYSDGDPAAPAASKGNKTASKTVDPEESAEVEQTLAQLDEEIALLEERLDVWWNNSDPTTPFVTGVLLLLVLGPLAGLGPGYAAASVAGFVIYFSICFYLYCHKRPMIKKEIAALERRRDRRFEASEQVDDRRKSPRGVRKQKR